MFEFFKKELRKEFLETKYGKKTNTYVCVSFVVAIISFIACLVVSDIVKNDLVILIFDIIFYSNIFEIIM